MVYLAIEWFRDFELTMRRSVYPETFPPRRGVEIEADALSRRVLQLIMHAIVRSGRTKRQR